jgi:hypothetical protein
MEEVAAGEIFLGRRLLSGLKALECLECVGP